MPGKTRVLVVEDDASLRSIYRAALKTAGFTVIAVEDGLDALREIERKVPSVVVLDLALPRLSGRDVKRELESRPDTARVPVVVVSGTDTTDLNEKRFASVLQKPVSPDVLLSAVEECLRRS